MKSFHPGSSGEQGLKSNILLLILIKSRQMQVSFLPEEKLGFPFLWLVKWGGDGCLQMDLLGVQVLLFRVSFLVFIQNRFF